LLIGLGLLVLAPLVLWLAFTMLRVETPNGTLLVEINDAETEARIRDGKVILTGADGKVRYTLSPRQHDNKIEAGPYKIHVEGADGLVLETTDFTLKKGETVTVHVTAAPGAPATNGGTASRDPDRDAAEWVLSVGGMVKVNGQGQEIKAAADLPHEPFQLTMAWLVSNKQVDDGGLTHFKGCRNLLALEMYETKVGDAGLANFSACKNLAVLGLGGTKTTDAGLANFKECKNLTKLWLYDTQISDAGLALFKDCDKLVDLHLSHTAIGDAGLAPFKDCKNLTHLHMDYTRLSDAGLDSLKDHKNLQLVSVRNTKVTAGMVENFKKALPVCAIGWGGRVVQSTASRDPDRQAAEWVLSIGGKVKVNAQDREITAAADLPAESFQLTSVGLHENKLVNDAGLAHLKECNKLTALDLFGAQISDAGLAAFAGRKNLTSLGLSNTNVGDAGLANFADCKNLTSLALSSTKVSDVGLAYFKDCKNLTVLSLWSAHVSDVGLASFKDCKNLTYLDLSYTMARDAGLANFKDCKNLKVLRLAGTQTGNTGLANFKDCKLLTQLELQKTKVTAAKIMALKKTLPQCKIEWDGL
jgi:Leucine-rich repeat (LRR) protein